MLGFILQVPGKQLFVCNFCSCSVTICVFPFLQDFLLLDEIKEHGAQLPSDGKTIVHVQDFTAFWDKVTNPPLHGLDH